MTNYKLESRKRIFLTFLLYTFYFLLCASFARAGDLTFSNAPQTSDSPSILLQREAVSLYQIQQAGPGGGGGGGGAVTIADGASVTLGAKADAAASSDTGTFSEIALTKRGLQTLTTIAGKDFATQTTLAAVKSDLDTIVTNTGNATLPTGTQVHSTALEASHVLKNSAGVLISVAVTNTSGSDQYIQLFDSATVPADSAVPLIAFKVQAGDARSYDIPITGLTFSAGIAISNSSTQATKTIGSADCLFLAEVK